MQIKKYLAINVREAINQIKQELGPEALIISTKNLKKGKNGPYGILSHDMVEVMAAIESEQKQDDTNQIFEKPQRPQSKVFEPPSKTQSDLSLDYLKNEIDALKRMIEKGFAQNSSQPLWANVYHQIRYMGLEEDIAAELLRSISKDNASIFTKGEISIKKYLKELLLHLINTSGPIKFNSGKPKIIAMVGPTGTGKTTTIAKLGGIFALKQRKKVAFISLDTIRIGGVEQLSSYARIMGLSMYTARRPEELRKHLESLTDKDCIFIDTAGYNHKDTKNMEFLNNLLATVPGLEKHLVLSATTQSKDLLKITKNFEQLGIDQLLFTKLDETTQIATIFNHMIYTNISLSYLATGQHVPDDLEVATPNRLSELIINNKSFD